jgi:hypothetical protein
VAIRIVAIRSMNIIKRITNKVNNKLDIVEEKLKQMLYVKQEPDYILDIGCGVIILIVLIYTIC